MKANDSRVEQRIFQKTAELISRKGIKGWNMDQLAEASGLAKNTLYKMIGSKENLLQRVTLEHIKDVQSKLSEIIEDNRDYLSALEAVVSIFPDLLNGNSTEQIREIFLEYPDIENCVRSHQDDSTKILLDFIQKGIDNGVLSDSLDAMQVFETLQAIVLFYMKKNLSAEERSARISTSIGYLLRGIRNNS